MEPRHEVLRAYGGLDGPAGRAYLAARQGVSWEPTWSVRDQLAETQSDIGTEISMEDLRHVARLAHLDLDAAEIDANRALADVRSLLGAVQRVRAFEPPEGITASADIDAEPLAGAALAHAAPLAADEATEGGDADGIVTAAAAREGPFFVVPRSLDD